MAVAVSCTRSGTRARSGGEGGATALRSRRGRGSAPGSRSTNRRAARTPQHRRAVRGEAAPRRHVGPRHAAGAGPDAQGRARSRGPFPPAKAEKVLRDIARALAYAHRCGVVHRDVKPENIFLDGVTGRALLSDFGVARQLNQNTDLTATGTAIGTPTYMAPEQIDGVRIDGRSTSIRSGWWAGSC
ncbi:MAG: protein kinase [Gemmatimonadaceae bacterium]